MEQAQPDNQPLGVLPPRSKAPLLFWGVMYAGWFGFLIWLVVRTSTAAHAG